MADAKITELTAIDAVVAADLFAVVDDPAGTPTTKKATASQIKDYIIALANTWTATQTITPAANTNALAVTGYSLTGSNAQSLIDLAGTWNTTGTPTAIKLNVTDTASNAASLLMDLQRGGTSQVLVSKLGEITVVYNGSSGRPLSYFSGSTGFRLNGAGITGLTIERGDASRVASFIGSRSVLCGSLYIGATLGGSDNACILERDADNILAQRNSTNAQTFRMYFSFTDASNYTRLALKTATTIHTIETESAGTGEANIDLALTPKGTGLVRYGTHSAIAAETVTGYITIKDAAGNSRKIAVVS